MDQYLWHPWLVVHLTNFDGAMIVLLGHISTVESFPFPPPQTSNHVLSRSYFSSCSWPILCRSFCCGFEEKNDTKRNKTKQRRMRRSRTSNQVRGPPFLGHFTSAYVDSKSFPLSCKPCFPYFALARATTDFGEYISSRPPVSTPRSSETIQRIPPTLNVFH